MTEPGNGWQNPHCEEVQDYEQDGILSCMLHYSMLEYDKGLKHVRLGEIQHAGRPEL